MNIYAPNFLATEITYLELFSKASSVSSCIMMDSSTALGSIDVRRANKKLQFFIALSLNP